MLQKVQGNEENLENLADIFSTGKITEIHCGGSYTRKKKKKKKHKRNVPAEKMKESAFRNQQGGVLQFYSADLRI